MAKPHGFPRKSRLRARDQIERTFRAGRFHRLGTLCAKSRPNGQPHCRFLIAVRRRVGSAPVRNRFKRRVRESVRRQQNLLIGGHDICLFLSREAQGIPDQITVDREIRTLLLRLQRSG